MKKKQSSSSRISSSSTFNFQDSNLKQLLKPIDFYITRSNDISQPLNHFHHKNLPYLSAPFLSQSFILYLDNLTNIKYITIHNYSHGSQMTISIAKEQNQTFQQVYKDKFICKGKTLQADRKDIDIGALPCKVIRIDVNKGAKVSSKNISLMGIDSLQIQQKLGDDYFKLLVENPMKILYST